MRALYICYHDPFATSGGGGLASHAFLKAFAEYFSGNLDLVCASECSGRNDTNIRLRNIYYVKERNLLQKSSSVFTGYMNRYVCFVKQLLKKAYPEYQFVIFDHNNIAGPLVDFVNKLGLRSVTIHHNCEREYFNDNNSGIYRLLFSPYVVKWERKAFQNSLLNLFLTSQDLSTFIKIYGLSKGINRVWGTFEYCESKQPIFESGNIKQKILTFAITGSLCNFQTEDAILYFFSNLYSYLPKDCRVIIAGRNPSEKLLTLCSKYSNVRVIPNPTDINSVLKNVDVYLCATRLGGGLKLRVMDGLKNGLPIITHVCSSRGFDVFFEKPFFKVFSTNEEFGECVCYLITTLNKGKINKREIYKIYHDYFSYLSGFNRLKKYMDDCKILTSRNHNLQ